MLPIAFDLFWGPMAFAIMGGLMVATLLTLLLLPTFYVALHGGSAAKEAKRVDA
jgi:multidrug efflux pump subunit AcrB